LNVYSNPLKETNPEAVCRLENNIMAELKYEPVSHDHKAFLKNAQKRERFRTAYNDLTEEYSLVREMLSARSKSGLTQEAVAELMGTTKSAVSRLESAGKHSPSLTTLRKYAQAVGCDLKIEFIQKLDSVKHETGGRCKAAYRLVHASHRFVNLQRFPFHFFMDHDHSAANTII
jgi:transcriptional regulator with XRE-family HTH domain